jgi:hypothetical protein
VIKGIEVMSTALVGAVKSVAPDKTTVEFTVGLESEAGKLTALFFDGSASADLKVTLEWNGKGEGGGAH